MADLEQPLHGGFTNRVVRVGNTVRRPAGHWSRTIQALLRHLQAKRFPAPIPLGFDGQGREVLSFIEGTASFSCPWPASLRDLRGLDAAGRFIRAYHEAVAGFAAPEPASWSIGARSILPGEVVCHGDFGASNLIWRNGRLAGLIDWDMAYPGRAVSDLAYAAWNLVPLCPDERTRPLGFEVPPDRRKRLVTLATAYGHPDLRELVAEVSRVQEEVCHRIAVLGGCGDEPWHTFLEGGLRERTRADQQWLVANLRSLVNA